MSKLTKIVYVEDEPDIQKIARISLENFGKYTVEIYSSGKEAIEKVSQFSPELILLDVMMPEMDGIQTFKELRKLESTKNIPIIFFTAKTQQNDIEELLGLGALGVIHKPFDPITLKDQIETLWEKR